MSRIFWDTSLFIYLFEGHGTFSNDVAYLRKRMIERGDELYTSTLTLGEVLVKPLERKDDTLKRRYLDVLTQRSRLLSFYPPAALRYAEIRMDRTIKPPDAIQLACAAQVQINLFVTNDDRLRNKKIAGIDFIVSIKHAQNWGV